MDPLLAPVLIVEDQPETQFIYEKLLQGSRYQPVSARNLREAREMVSQVRPRAVLLDILLRGEDSWRWLTELKNDPATAQHAGAHRHEHGRRAQSAGARRRRASAESR